VSTESETEGTDLVHTVTLSNESAVATTFSFVLAGDTAAVTDFTNPPTFSNGVTLSGGNISVPAGVTSFTVTVPTTNDTIDESDEVIDITVGGVAATGTIEDNDSAPTISSVSTESETEGTDLVHTVTLSNESAVATTFSFVLAGDTAAVTDFTNPPTFSNGVTLSGGNISVPAGVTSFTVTVPTTNDTIDESDEVIDLTVGGVAATGTIEDDDTPAIIGGTDTGAVLEDSNVDISGNLTTSGTLTITDPDIGQESFTAATGLVGTYGTLNINAAGEWSYTADNSQSAIQALTPSDTIIDTIEITSFDGTTHDINISITGVNLTATVNTNPVDENAQVVGNVISDGTADSDDILSAGSILTTNLTLHYDASKDTEGDGIWENSSLTTPAPNFDWSFDHASATTFTPNTVTSALPGITEAYSFNVNASDPTGAGFTDFSGANDDSFSDITDDPTNNSASFEMWFRTEDVSDHDLLFETGGATDGLSIRINGTVVEFFAKDSDESAQLSFDLASIGIDPTTEFVQLVGVVTINGDVDLYINGALAAQDTSGLLADWAGSDDAGLGAQNSGINLATPTVFEGEIAIFNFYESALTNANVLSNYQAIAGFSVTEVNGSPISLHTPIPLTNGSVIMAADGSYEYTPNSGFSGSETFTYTIENTNGDTDTASITITVDEAPTITSVTSASETEGTDLLHTVSLSHSSTADTMFSFDLADNTATAGTDFSSTPTFSNGVTLSGGNITVPAGVTSFTVSVETTQDTIDESDEVIDLTVGGVAATGTIEDNDTAPTISNITDENEAEGTDLVHVVTLSNPSATTTTFAFSLVGDTATIVDDFTSPPTFSDGVTLSGGNISVPAGVTSFTVTIPTISDAISETTETVTLTIGGTSATGAINDNPAIIGGTDTALVVEDTNLDSVGDLRASGLLTITDPDSGEDSFTAATGLVGTYGTLSC
jgi:VCBS repeat-containing protein